MLMNSLSEAALGWRHQAVQTWSAVMWHIAWAAEQRADRVHRQTYCSWSLEVVDSTLSYFPFRATQLRCTACFPPLSASEPITHLRRSFSAFSHNACSFFLSIYQVNQPSTNWMQNSHWPYLVTLQAQGNFFVFSKTFKTHFDQLLQYPKFLALMVHRHKGKDQYVVLCMFR